MRQIWKVAGLALALVALAAGPASAQDAGPDDNDNDQVVLHGTLVVPEGETVGAAVIFDGPVTVDGTVEQSLVVFNGDVDISGTVNKDVVVFNGDVVVRSGASIGGNLVSRRAPTVEQGATVEGDQVRITGRLDIGEIGFASRFAWWLGYSISTLVLGLLLLLFGPGLDVAITRVARERMGAAIGFGALWFFLLPVAAVVLLVTVVGIPLGLFLLLALALIYTVGYVAGAHGVGRLVMKPPSSRYAAFLVGWLILRVIALIPVLGGLAWLLSAIFGLGLLAAAARRMSGEPETAVVMPEAPPRPA
jgi:hypothetical protein